MVFRYYNRLTPAQKRIYHRSDALTSLLLPQSDALLPLVAALAMALKQEDREQTAASAQALVSAFTDMLRVPLVRVEVLEARPHSAWGELQGLYTPAETGKVARVTLWMRTAKRRRVVAFRTFLRTLVHELCHHLDCELFRLEETFHTEGFYKRESSLVHQLLGNVIPRT